MCDVAGLNAAGLNIPQLLNADAVALRIDVVELFCGDKFFGKRASRAFGEDGDFGAKFVAGREVVFGLAILVDAFVFGDDAGDSIAFVNEFSASKFLEDVDSGGFDQSTQPFRNSAERNNVVSLVLKRRRCDREAQR